MKKKAKYVYAPGEQLALDLGAAGHGEALAAPIDVGAAVNRGVKVPTPDLSAPTHHLSAIRLYTKAMAEGRNIPTEGTGYGSFCTEYPPPGHVLARFISDAIKSKDAEACVECVRWVP